MKSFIIFVLLVIVVWQSAQHGTWWTPLKTKLYNKIDTTIGHKIIGAPETSPADEQKVVNIPPPSSATSPTSQKTYAIESNDPQVPTSVMADGPKVNPQAVTNSGSGSYNVQANGITLSTDATTKKSMVTISISPTQKFNYVYYDLDFTSQNSTGIVTTFLNNQDLGYFDERFYGPVGKKQTMGFASTEPGTYSVSFVLDSAAPSNVSITNIGTGLFYAVDSQGNIVVE